MTDVQLLINLVSKDPDQDISAAMLVDELMDARGMLRSEADRHVERLRADCRSAKQIDLVASFIRERGRRWVALMAEVALAIGFDDGRPFGLAVMGGDLPPSAAVRPGPNALTGERDIWSVALPAGWALARLKQLGYPLDPPARTRRK